MHLRLIVIWYCGGGRPASRANEKSKLKGVIPKAALLFWGGNPSSARYTALIYHTFLIVAYGVGASFYTQHLREDRTRLTGAPGIMPTRNGAHTMQIALHREKTANFPLWCAPPSSLFEVDKTIPKHRNKICKGCPLAPG